MATITEKSLKTKIKEDRMDFSCPSFLKEVSKRDDLLEVGKFWIKFQLILKGLDQINPMLEVIIKKDVAAELQATAKKINSGIADLKVGLKRKQEEEKSGKNKKASTEAASMIKSMNGQINDELSDMGGSVRRRVKEGLKKKKFKVKITSISQNSFGKIKMNRSAFTTAPTVEYDKKTWGNIAKNINDLAFATGNKTVEEYITLSSTVTEKILQYGKVLKKSGDDKKDPNEKNSKDSKNTKKSIKKEQAQKELRDSLISYTQNIASFKKEISSAKIVAKATASMKKVKKDLDKRGQTLLKQMSELETWQNMMMKEIDSNDQEADTAINLLDKGNDAKLLPMATTFAKASLRMKKYSSQTKQLAKRVGVEAKKNVKKG